MQLVERAELHPNYCILTGSPNGPFIDCEVQWPIVEPRIYLSLPAVDKLARFLSYSSPEEVDVFVAQIAALKADNAILRKAVADGEEFRLAAEFTLNQFDSRVKGKPGNKPSREQLLEDGLARAS